MPDRKASDYLSVRNELFSLLQGIDVEIDKALNFKTSKRAAETARQLFAERARVLDELLTNYGIEAEPHPALSKDG